MPATYARIVILSIADPSFVLADHKYHVYNEAQCLAQRSLSVVTWFINPRDEISVSLQHQSQSLCEDVCPPSWHLLQIQTLNNPILNRRLSIESVHWSAPVLAVQGSPKNACQDYVQILVPDILHGHCPSNILWVVEKFSLGYHRRVQILLMDITILMLPSGWTLHSSSVTLLPTAVSVSSLSFTRKMSIQLRAYLKISRCVNCSLTIWEKRNFNVTRACIVFCTFYVN